MSTETVLCEPVHRFPWCSGYGIPNKAAPGDILGALQFLEKTVEHLLCAGCGAAGRGCEAAWGPLPGVPPVGTVPLARE